MSSKSSLNILSYTIAFFWRHGVVLLLRSIETTVNATTTTTVTTTTTRPTTPTTATTTTTTTNCMSNAAMQCIGQTYTITLGMVSDGGVRWRCPMSMSGNVWE